MFRVRRRNGSKEKRIHESEDDAVDADADAERHGHGDGKAGATPHRPKGVAHVANEVGEQAGATAVAHRLAMVVETTKRHERAAVCLVRRQALGDKSVGLHRDMESKLFLHPRLGCARRKQ